MKITKIECIPVSMKFAKPMVMSVGSIPAADGVVVKIHTDAGITGRCRDRRHLGLVYGRQPGFHHASHQQGLRPPDTAG